MAEVQSPGRARVRFELRVRSVSDDRAKVGDGLASRRAEFRDVRGALSGVLRPSSRTAELWDARPVHFDLRCVFRSAALPLGCRACSLRLPAFRFAALAMYAPTQRFEHPVLRVEGRAEPLSEVRPAPSPSREECRTTAVAERRPKEQKSGPPL